MTATLVGVLLASASWAAEPASALAPAPGCAPWPDGLAAELSAGLAALPEPLRAFPGGPLTLCLHAESAPFGMGDGSAARPLWTDGQRTFHLYGVTPGDERRASWRLEALRPAQVEAAWRRRAVVHAVVARWDAALGLSTRRAWRALNGWLWPFERPLTWTERALNLAPGAYSRSLGQRSAALDLATFAEELFVPAESLAADALAVDDTVACQERSKARVLWSALVDAKVLATPYEARPCPALDTWVDRAHLDGVEVLLVQASGRRPESLFGHVLLRPVRTTPHRAQGPSFETAVQLAAVTDPNAGPGHLVRGVFGGYRLQVMTLSWRDLEREMLEQEQRSMRRFRMTLSPAQAVAVLERSWELERRGAWDYQFFTDNCATGLVWLLQGALGDAATLTLRGAFIVSPGAVVDDLAHVELDGRPLLAPVTPQLESTCARAERSAPERDRLLRALVDAAPASARPALASVSAQLRSSDVRARLRGARRLLAYTVDAPPARREALHALWTRLVWIDRCTADLAQRSLDELEVAVLRPDAAPRLDVQAELDARAQQFERESHLARQRMVLDRAEDAARLRRALAKRPLTDDERDERARAQAELAHFDRLVELQATAVDAALSSVDAQAYVDADERERARAEGARVPTALHDSGHWRTRVAGGVWLDGAARPAVGLVSSGLLESLGEQRLRGFQPGVALRGLDGELWLEPVLGWPRLLMTRFTVFGVRSLVTAPSWLERRGLSRFGWGMDFSVDAWRGRPIEARAGMTAELVALSRGTERYERFVSAGFVASAQLGWGDGPTAALLGPGAFATARLPLGGHSVNALVAEARAQLFVTSRAGATFVADVHGKLRLELRAGPLVLGVGGQVTWWYGGQHGRAPVWLATVDGELQR